MAKKKKRKSKASYSLQQLISDSKRCFDLYDFELRQKMKEQIQDKFKGWRLEVIRKKQYDVLADELAAYCNRRCKEEGKYTDQIKFLLDSLYPDVGWKGYLGTEKL